MSQAEETAEGGVEDLLEFLRDSRGLDFTGYKRPSLTRRIRKRMDAVQASSFDDYRDILEVDPHEHDALVDTILIDVTSFFRDPMPICSLQLQHGSGHSPASTNRRAASDSLPWRR